MEYEIVCWPESQDLMERNGFCQNCRLVNGERGISEYGSSAYLVPSKWLRNEDNTEYDELDECECTCDEVYDQELEDLYLL